MDFNDAAAYAKDIEKNALEHIKFTGKIEVTQALDLYPKDIYELTIEDLINRYEKIQKVIQTSKLEIFEKAPIQQEKEIVVQREEVETKVKALTISAVEDLEKELAALPLPPKAPESHGLAFERAEPERPVESELEFPVAREEEKKGQKVQVPPPPLAYESADRAAEAKYKEIEQHFKREQESDVTEDQVKKKMLDLTKELFKEKSIARREQIKTEIVALKNMLQEIGKKGSAAGKDFSSPMFDTLDSSQMQELASIKNSLANQYNERIEASKSSFYQKLSSLGEGEDQAKKRLYETLVFELTRINEELPKEIQDKARFIISKHQNELDKLKAGIKDEDTKAMPKIDSKRAELQDRYSSEFSLLQTSLTKSIESLIQKTGSGVFKEKQGEEGIKEKSSTSDPNSIVFEINEMDEGTLLYHLHSKQPDVYKDYERGHLSKPEALHKARIFMAKEKGLSDDAVKKFFGSVDGE